MELQEKLLHHIWDQRHLIHELKTVSGKSLNIIYQGQYNTNSGPDFKNVILNLDGQNIQGDVEIHFRAYDWTAHHHNEDPMYNNTILHVVLEHKSNMLYTLREDAQAIEILELQNQIDADIAKLFNHYQNTPPQKHIGLCDYFMLSSDEGVNQLLKANGWERFQKKCNRFNAELMFNSFDQLLYNGIMEAMGYDKNKFNTLAIAQHFSWERLKEWHSNGMDSITLASIWLNYAGLMDKTEALMDSDFAFRLNKAFEYQNFTTDKTTLKWNLFRIRPANHPVKRIIQSAYIIHYLLNKGILNSLLAALKDCRVTNISSFNKSLLAIFQPESEIWDIIEKPGKTLISTITGNIILPILYLYAQKTNDDGFCDKIKQTLNKLPAQHDNYITHFMKGYMNDNQWALATTDFSRQQGLMHLYYGFCKYRLCEACLSEKQKCIQSM